MAHTATNLNSNVRLNLYIEIFLISEAGEDGEERKPKELETEEKKISRKI